MPTKCIVLNRTVQVNAQVQYIDFEGRSDGESLLKILSQLRPRRVIVVRGTPESTATIDSHCKENVDVRVFTPSRGETVDATSETHIYQVCVLKLVNCCTIFNVLEIRFKVFSTFYLLFFLRWYQTMSPL